MQDYDPDLDFAPPGQARAAGRIDPTQYQHYVDLRRSRQHMPFAVLAGFVGAAIGVALWLAMVVYTNLQLGWMAAAVAGFTAIFIRIGGKGFDRVFGFAGAALTAVGCAAGFLLTGCWFVSVASENAGLLDVVTAMTGPIIVEISKAMYDPIDAAFFTVAIVVGFRLSYRRLSRAEKLLVMVDGPDAEDILDLDAA